MSLATSMKESILQRRMYTQQALYYRFRKDKVNMRLCLNLSRSELINQRYFLGEPPF